MSDPAIKQDEARQTESSDRADYESTAITRGEYITAMVHLYRGELARADNWRMRLDNTTNWAVLTTAALLTLSFGETRQSHWVLLLGLLVISVFWVFESRRFRFEDLWRSRVRKIEENFYGPILRRDPVSPSEDWGHHVAEDLFHPRLKLTRAQAMRTRLMRNYWAIFLILLVSWAVKILVHPTTASSWNDVRQHLQMGLLPWWAPLAFIGVFSSGLILLVLVTPRWSTSQLEYWTDKRKDH